MVDVRKLIALAIVLLLIPAAAATAGDAKRGLMLAKQWCTECHDISGHTTSDQAPGWRSIANDPERDLDKLHAFLQKPRQPMPPLQLSKIEIEDLVAYIKTLKAK
ncbi:MAG: cytochrome c [Alphaproteobacteria bacterium]|jgi:mono/diheme cytochrome c family protein|nr:cytochrome c [Alphaproteobacteria bacterium]